MNIIKNKTQNSKTYSGLTILAGESHLIAQHELLGFQNSENLIADLMKETPEASIASEVTPLNELTGLEGVKILLGNFVSVESIPQNNPFCKKVLDCGCKLYRRKKGVRQICAGNSETSIILEIPYGKCKVDELEIVNCSGNDCLDLLIKDDANGTYSGIPNKILNQFGFDVCLSDLYYSDSSQYDAELMLGMKIEVIFKNKDADSKNIGINFTLHEMKYT